LAQLHRNKLVINDKFDISLVIDRVENLLSAISAQWNGHTSCK